MGKMIVANDEEKYMPQWYITLRAARYLRVPPWTLELPENKDWVYKAHVAEAAENQAEEARRKHNEWRRKAKLPLI